MIERLNVSLRDLTYLLKRIESRSWRKMLVRWWMCFLELLFCSTSHQKNLRRNKSGRSGYRFGLKILNLKQQLYLLFDSRKCLENVLIEIGSVVKSRSLLRTKKKLKNYRSTCGQIIRPSRRLIDTILQSIHLEMCGL